MKSRIIFYFLPCSVLFIRYYRRSKLAFFLVEIAPYMLISFFNNVEIYYSILSVILLYSFYEIGYVYNDNISAAKEINPTKRKEYAGISIPLLIICRSTVGLIIFWVFFFDISGLKFYGAALVLLISFIIHNSSFSSNIRVGTFISLNLCKILFILFLLGPNAISSYFGFLPYIIVKIIDYLKAKKLILIHDLNGIILPIYMSTGIISILLSVQAFYAFIPLFFNFNKRQLLIDSDDKQQ